MEGRASPPCARPPARRQCRAQENSTRLQRKLSSATKSLGHLEVEVQRSEAARAESAAHLEAVEAQVLSMRSEVGELRGRLAMRERQLTQHVQVSAVVLSMPLAAHTLTGL